MPDELEPADGELDYEAMLREAESDLAEFAKCMNFSDVIRRLTQLGGEASDRKGVVAAEFDTLTWFMLQAAVSAALIRLTIAENATARSSDVHEEQPTDSGSGLKPEMIRNLRSQLAGIEAELRKRFELESHIDLMDAVGEAVDRAYEWDLPTSLSLRPANWDLIDKLLQRSNLESLLAPYDADDETTMPEPKPSNN